MKTPDEIREELNRLFSPEESEKKFAEWTSLVDYGLLDAAESRPRMWAIEAALRIKKADEESDRQSRQVSNYTELGDAENPSGITINGFAEIGHAYFSGVSISLQVVELVNVDLQIATYGVRASMYKDERNHSANLTYEEIPKLLSAIEALKRVDAKVTMFKDFQADWKCSDNFSLTVFSNDNRTQAAINIGGASVFLNTVEKYEELAKLFTSAKAYIDSHLQCHGSIGFLLIEKLNREKTELLKKLPELVIDRTSPYMKVLFKKYCQLTYLDDYGFREQGSFASELDRFISRVIPELPDENLELAKRMIVKLVEEFALDPANHPVGFFDGMSPLDYEQQCAKVFSQAGWTTSMTPKTGDQGADIVIKYNEMNGVVQCKLYTQPVGNAAVQEVIAAREYYQAAIAIVVSNANFTASARQLAGIANVALLHHDDIADHSLKLGLELFAEPSES